MFYWIPLFGSCVCSSCPVLFLWFCFALFLFLGSPYYCFPGVLRVSSTVFCLVPVLGFLCSVPVLGSCDAAFKKNLLNWRREQENLLEESFVLGSKVLIGSPRGGPA